MLLARLEPELMQKHSIPRQQQWNKTKHDLSPPRTKWSPVLATQTLVQRCAIPWVVHLFRPRLLPNFSVHLCVTPGASPAPHAKLCAIRLLCFFEAVATPAVMHVAACLCYSLRDFFFVGEVHLPFTIFWPASSVTGRGVTQRWLCIWFLCFFLV